MHAEGEGIGRPIDALEMVTATDVATMYILQTLVVKDLVFPSTVEIAYSCHVQNGSVLRKVALPYHTLCQHSVSFNDGGAVLR